MHSFPFLLPPCLSLLHLDLFKLRPPRVGEKDDDDQPKNQSSNSHTPGQTSSVDPLAKTDDQDTSAKWECRQSPILMPPRVAKILNQENHVSTTQWLPEDVWKDLNFMVGLSSSLYLKVMRCVCGLEKWYHILKPEEATKLYSNHFIKVRRMFFERCVNKAVERMEVKGGIRLSIREVFCVSYQELRRIHCKKEYLRRKLMCVGWYPYKPLSLANLVNLRTRFLFRGVVLSHPEIF